MRTSRLFLSVLLLLFGPAAWAQQGQGPPHIGYVYPAGGQRGTTFLVKVGGQYLDRVAGATVSGTGVQAVVLEHLKPLTPRQIGQLRERLQELLKKVGDPQAQKEIAEIRKQLAQWARRPTTPAIAETVTLQITIAPQAELGVREIRLATPRGLTNPLRFEVGCLPEFRENEAPLLGPLGRPRAFFRPQDGQPDTRRTDPTPITLPAVVNGWISPGGVDRFRFPARQGQRFVATVRARALIPYLADAVPGWFQAVITLMDAEGHELASCDDFRFDPDPVLCHTLPRDGEYLLEIRDSIYRGREDFVYRITVGELPFLADIFPLGGPAGAKTEVQVRGWNLPTDRLVMDTTGKAPGVYPLSVRQGEWESNSVAFAVDSLPECVEHEPNQPQRKAQEVTLPVIINGRIHPAGDWDVFAFQARAGSEIVAEVQARRLGSPLDSFIRLTDATGRSLAFCDDWEDPGAGWITHHADSRLSAILPKDGTYFISLRDMQHHGGPEYAYRLRLSPPRPDFELRVAPSSLSVRAGASVPFTVYALRKDGFSGEILLGLQGLPVGFTLSGARIPPGQDKVRLTLTAPPVPLPAPATLHLEGRAVIGGKEVSRPAVPAEEMMQAFAYQHLVPSQEMKVAVLGRALPRLRGVVAMARPAILSPTPVLIHVGGTARVEVGLPVSTPLGKIRVELSDPPQGITLQEVLPKGAASELVLRSDEKTKQGLEGNLIVSYSLETPSAEKGSAGANRARLPIGVLPAIPFRVE